MITDDLAEVLAFIRERRWEGMGPDRLDRLTSDYSKVIAAARKAARGRRVKPDDLIVRQLAELDAMLGDPANATAADSIRKTWGYPYGMGRDSRIKRT